jgi:hypothetical protein
MADLAQVVAAVAAGALLTVTTTLIFKLHRMQRRADRERRIEAVVSATVSGVDALRQQARAAPGRIDSPPPEGTVEVHSKAHLRMLISESRAASAACSRPLPEGVNRPRQARGSRR